MAIVFEGMALIPKFWFTAHFILLKTENPNLVKWEKPELKLGNLIFSPNGIIGWFL